MTIGQGPRAGLNGQTCGHIAAARAGRGFAATCVHPEAAEVVPAAREITAKIPSTHDLDEVTLLGRHTGGRASGVRSSAE